MILLLPQRQELDAVGDVWRIVDLGDEFQIANAPPHGQRQLLAENHARKCGT